MSKMVRRTCLFGPSRHDATPEFNRPPFAAYISLNRQERQRKRNLAEHRTRTGAYQAGPGSPCEATRRCKGFGRDYYLTVAAWVISGTLARQMAPLGSYSGAPPARPK